MKVLVTGATGLVGKKVGQLLHEKGHEVTIVSRSAEKKNLPFPCRVVAGDLTKSPIKELGTFDGVIHLLGESVAGGRWTEAKKERIYNSRILSTQNLLQSLSSPPKVFVSASAVGIYGDRGNEELTEESAVGEDFLAKVCIDWETEARKKSSQVRTVIGRFGVVLHKTEGAYPQMSLPFRYGAGAILGEGQQWMSWIHHQDLSILLVRSLEDEKMEGVYNFVAPEPIQNKDFSRVLSKTIHRPLWMSVPKVVLKTLLGEMSQVLLSSQRAYPTRLNQMGHGFEFKNAADALKEIEAV